MISVIIPNKKGREIETDLDFQTFKDFELIIIHDEDLKGQSWALNQGAKKAKGEYLMFLDDDLDIEDTLLEDLYNALDGTEHSFSYCNFKKEGMIKGVHRAFPYDYDQLKLYNYISNNSLVRAKDFPGFDENIYRFKDYDLWLTMAEQGKTGVWVDKVLFTAYFYEDGISVQGNPVYYQDIVQKKHNL